MSYGRDLRGAADVASAMTETMVCRGPDAGGLWTSEHAILGHRRLAVIDLEGGRQPMAASDDDILPVVTYTGEVYNFQELRDELTALGHAFRTSSDTEVVLRAYLEWGAAFAERLNGIYAFAIWDPRTEELLLVRDRMGVKPLYYYPTADGVIFGIVSHVVELAAARAPYGVYPVPADVERLDADPVRCLDADASEAMVAQIDQAHKDGDTLGGVVEVLAYGVPVGLGSHVHWDRRLDARLAAALMGIQAIKGVEVGDGFELARVPGSRAHDEIVTTDEGIRRATGRSGGTEGGLSTGELLRVRAAMKPIATVPRALRTVDVATGEAAQAHHQRSDVCAVPAAGIVAEAMVALVLADAVAEKFGGDSVAETRRNVRGYLDNLAIR
ncbi:chorismate synthase [Streptomyces kebangsaanensis]|uniref:chorismate synthase n=1 Tax=Streptomyces kebangsaanensis TaxID=864058 RepID=UPI0013013443|nr:chorismate synthase [Streptomyces kebangsaanensis]